MSTTHPVSKEPGSTQASHNAQVTLFHNPNCSKSRGALELLGELAGAKNLALNVVEYLTTPPSHEQLTELVQRLPNAPAELVRNDKNFKALGLDAGDYTTAEQVIDLLLSHPQLMQRPIALFKGRAAIGRPPEDLKELFS